MLFFALRALACLLIAGSGLLPQAVTAQVTTEQMIEQLRSPRTRSLRNLNIEPAETAPGQAAAGAPAAATPPPSLTLLVEFDFDSDRVRPESQQALSRLAQALNSSELAQSRFAVEGHTDAKGRAEYNLGLSRRRAFAVRNYLVAQGVTATRLAPSGKGSSELAVPADPHARENRRVRIVNLD